MCNVNFRKDNPRLYIEVKRSIRLLKGALVRGKKDSDKESSTTNGKVDRNEEDQESALYGENKSNKNKFYRKPSTASNDFNNREKYIKLMIQAKATPIMTTDLEAEVEKEIPVEVAVDLTRGKEEEMSMYK